MALEKLKLSSMYVLFVLRAHTYEELMIVAVISVNVLFPSTIAADIQQRVMRS